MVSPRALKPETRVGNYTIIQAVDINNHSVVYRAHIGDTDQQIWLLEFIPVDLAGRQRGTLIVRAKRGKTKLFEEALTLFLQEARILSQIRDPYIVRIREYTEARGTVFVAMDLEQGQSLHEHLQHTAKLGEKELRPLFVPLLKGLRVVHSSGLLHRDINPKHIFIRDMGPPLLIGFGSTQRVLTRGEVGLESRVTPGFSPIEQYHEQGNLGPWTDLYAIGAVLYKCISGITPIDAPKRVTAIAEGNEDPLVPAMEIGHGDYHTNILSNIDWLMQPVIDKRPESAGQILGPLVESTAPRPVPARPSKIPPPAEKEPVDLNELKLHQSRLYTDLKARALPKEIDTRRNNRVGWAIAVLFFAGVGIFALWPQLQKLNPGEQTAKSQTTIEDTSIPKDILDRPLPGEEPPELPESVEFTREVDDSRANVYRELEQHDRTIKSLLDSAQAKLTAGKLIEPADDSALADYRAILAMDEDNIDAQHGIDEIADGILRRAKDEFEKGELLASEKLLNYMLTSDLESDDVVALRKKIEEEAKKKAAAEERIRQRQLAEQKRIRQEQLAEQKRLKQEEQEKLELINALLSKATAAMEQGELRKGAGADALDYYREVLAIDATNEEANNGIASIVRHYVDLANQALAADQFVDVENLLLIVATIEPENEAVDLLRDQMKARREVVRQSELQTERKKELEQIAQRKYLQEKELELDRFTLVQGLKAYYRGEYQTAYTMLKPLAEKGNERAQFRVGVMYLRGRGVERDKDSGTKWIRRAFPAVQTEATAGEAWAQADLGSLYQDGLLVAQNDTEAVRWYLLAAEQGYAGAQTNLGTMYANGSGVTQNRNEAIKWLTRAAEQGDKIAQNNLVALGIGNTNNPTSRDSSFESAN